jgi:alpha-beta hydrolase superfamily lysophospholipase
MTAMQAYKLTHFYDKGTVKTIPQKDKSSWDQVHDILLGPNATKSSSTAPIDTSLKTVYLSTKDQLIIEGWYFKTTDSLSKGTVILFHGHGGSKSGVLAESDVFRSLGYNTLLIDFRAHGNSEGNTSTIGYKESEEVDLAYQYILKEKKDSNIILWGISMGAAAITKAVNDYALLPKKIILEMPYGSILQAAEGRIRMMGVSPEPLARFVTFWGGIEHGFWAFDMKPFQFAKNINSPVLIQWGEKDNRVTRKEIDMIYNNISVTKKLVTYSKSGHESLCKSEHSKWMFEMYSFLSQ